MITPSDIAYVIAVIKNGQEMWDQEMTLLARNDEMGEDEPTKKNGHSSHMALDRSVCSG